MSRFQFINHTADKGVSAFADSQDELFAVSARGLFALMVDVNPLKASLTKSIELNAIDVGALFIKWLSELLYLYETESLVPIDFQINASDKHLTAEVGFANIKKNQIELKGAGVKAVTYHDLTIEKTNAEWHSLFYVDV